MACCIVGGLAFCVMGTLLTGLPGKMGLYVLVCVLLNGVFAFGMTITSHISPTRQRGAMLAIHVGCMTLSGMLAPWLVGKLVTLFNGDIARGFETAVHCIGLATVCAQPLGCTSSPRQPPASVCSPARPSARIDNAPTTFQSIYKPCGVPQGGAPLCLSGTP